jgi:hypothetical protein
MLMMMAVMATIMVSIMVRKPEAYRTALLFARPARGTAWASKGSPCSGLVVPRYPQPFPSQTQ